uniref:Uncharacterized protein n=1 Tax=Xiphophorus maculatus TaxID=8083 RepID=A0A3B5QPQ1_XIPMA
LVAPAAAPLQLLQHQPSGGSVPFPPKATGTDMILVLVLLNAAVRRAGSDKFHSKHLAAETRFWFWRTHQSDFLSCDQQMKSSQTPSDH